MNDFQMTFLANEHRNSLVGEADRQRRTRTTRKAPANRQRQARTRPLGLILFFGRVVLF